MRYSIRYTKSAKEDLKRHLAFLIAHDRHIAQRARQAIEAGIELLQQFPFTCRKATSENPFLREMVISFGTTGYVALFEIESDKTITILAIRHQRENDFH